MFVLSSSTCLMLGNMNKVIPIFHGQLYLIFIKVFEVSHIFSRKQKGAILSITCASSLQSPHSCCASNECLYPNKSAETDMLVLQATALTPLC